MEIATHPILRATRVNRENPIHSHPTRVCVSCVTNTGLPKSTDLRHDSAGKADHDTGRFLVWPGGEAVEKRPRPAVSGERSIALQSKRSTSNRPRSFRHRPDQRSQNTVNRLRSCEDLGNIRIQSNHKPLLIDTIGKSVRAGFSIVESILSPQIVRRRITTSDFFVFFMSLTFVSGRDPCTDDPNDVVATFREADEQQSVQDRVPDNDLSNLFCRMLVIAEDLRKMIGENGACLIKTNLVFLQVGLRFVVIPFKSDAHLESSSR